MKKKTKTAIIQIRCSQKEKAMLKSLAKHEGRSVTQTVISLFREKTRMMRRTNEVKVEMPAMREPAPARPLIPVRVYGSGDEEYPEEQG